MGNTQHSTHYQACHCGLFAHTGMDEVDFPCQSVKGQLNRSGTSIGLPGLAYPKAIENAHLHYK